MGIPRLPPTWHVRVNHHARAWAHGGTHGSRVRGLLEVRVHGAARRVNPTSWRLPSTSGVRGELEEGAGEFLGLVKLSEGISHADEALHRQERANGVQLENWVLLADDD